MRTLLLLLLICFSASASADWVRVGETNHPEPQIYIDPDSVKQTGPMAIMRRVMELRNYSKADTDKVKSVKRLAEYDCMDRRHRVLQEFGYSADWAKGESIDLRGIDNPDRQWQAIKAGSVAEGIFVELCPQMND